MVYTSEGDFCNSFWKSSVYMKASLQHLKGFAYDSANNRIVVADEKNYRVQSIALSDLGL